MREAVLQIEEICNEVFPPNEYSDEEYFESIGKKFRVAIIKNEKYCNVYLDHKDCWNKVGHCPLGISLPSNKRQIKRFEKALEFLLTKEGKAASNTFEFCDLYEEFNISNLPSK